MALYFSWKEGVKLIKENQAEFELANILKYQRMPVKKDPGLIVVLDSSNRPRKHDEIQIAIDNFRDDDKPGHNTQVCGVIRQVVPGANIVTFNYFGGEKPKIIDWIIENKKDICVVNCSFTSGDTEIERLEEYDITVVSSSGNSGKSITYPASLLWVISVGAFEEWHYKVADYSSYGETLDVVALTNIYLMVDPETNKTHWFNGTSCSGPVAAAMLWLYQSRHGIKFTREQARQFLHYNTIDLLEKGHDAKSGYGLFILPEKTKVNLFIGSDKYLIDGITHRMDTAPILKSKRTFVPIRFVAEALGFKVTWGGDIGGNRNEIIIEMEGE